MATQLGTIKEEVLKVLKDFFDMGKFVQPELYFYSVGVEEMCSRGAKGFQTY